MNQPLRSVQLDGKNLTIDQVISVACYSAKVSLNKKAIKAMMVSREYVKSQAEANEIVYGVTTGFGPNADTIVLGDDAKELQRNLLISHAVGGGTGSGLSALLS